MKDLNDVAQVIASATSSTPESVSFARAIQGISNGNVKIGNENELKEAVAGLQNNAKQALDAVQTAWDASLADFENYKQLLIATKADVDFDAENGKGSFKKAMDDILATLNEGYGAETQKIKSAYNSAIGMLYNQGDKAAHQYGQEKSETDPWFQWGRGKNESNENFFERKFYENTDIGQSIKKMLDDALTLFGSTKEEAAELGKVTSECFASGLFSDQQSFNDGMTKMALEGVESFKKALYEGAQGIDFSQFALKGQPKTPQYSSEDVGNILSNTGIMGFATGAYMSSMQHGGTDSQTVSQVGQAWNDSGKPVEVNVNVQTDVELDGDKVGESAYRFSQRQMAYTNGY